MAVMDVNEVALNANLALYVAGSLLTQFAYANGTVSVSVRSQVAFTCGELAEQLDNVAQWSSMVADKLSPPSTVVGEYEIEVKRKNGKVTADFRYGNVKLTDAEHVFDSGVIEFESRPACGMPWSDFLRWVAFLRTYQRECANPAWSVGG